ncbi:hypothetical protein BN132_971 [Cronobacter turicensis 564]|nr:hypothetical protein BN132_971 [Cronobacter turicensis 564]
MGEGKQGVNSMNPFIYVFGLLLTLDALRELAGASSVMGLW